VRKHAIELFSEEGRGTPLREQHAWLLYTMPARYHKYYLIAAPFADGERKRGT